MNISKITGLIVILITITIIMILESNNGKHVLDIANIYSFISPSSFLLTIGVVIGGVLYIFDWSFPLKTILKSFGKGDIKDVNELKLSIIFFDSASRLSIAAGSIGMVAGIVKMFSNLSDPATIGPALALSISSAFYAVILSELIIQPLKHSLIVRQSSVLSDIKDLDLQSHSRFSVLIISSMCVFIVALFYLFLYK